MLLLGIDIGTSSIKVSVVDAETQKCLGSASFPEKEFEIISNKSGWAEQSPEMWWENVQSAILKLNAQQKYDPKDIAAIGIAYQMHGLVIVDKEQQLLRNSIIWCDSRSVEIGEKAFSDIGKEKCLSHLLNSPGNFTASKLAWVKQHEPDLYKRTFKMMLPGDFIAMKFTGQITTSMSSLSEGIMWDFQKNKLSQDVFEYYGFSESIVPEIRDVFSEHGKVTVDVAAALSLKRGIPVTYKAGDQPNNALSLNVLQPGEVAATAGTSGVIYGVTDQFAFDNDSRINTFAHVNYSNEQKKFGVLLCINGTGILNRWIKSIAGKDLTYQQINHASSIIDPGSDGLVILPFGNGAERILKNKIINAQFHNIDFNKHSDKHLFRAAQEGIAFAFRYGLDIMKENGMNPQIIRTGKANMFLSDVFTDCFVNTLKIPVEMYDCDGSVGAAIGAGIGAKVFSSSKEAFKFFKPIKWVEPANVSYYDEYYDNWLNLLKKQLI